MDTNDSASHNASVFGTRADDSLEPMRSREVDGASGLGVGPPKPQINAQAPRAAKLGGCFEGSSSDGSSVPVGRPTRWLL